MKTPLILTSESRTAETTANWMLASLAGIAVFGLIWASGHEDRPQRKGPTVVQEASMPEIQASKLESGNLSGLAAQSQPEEILPDPAPPVQVKAPEESKPTVAANQIPTPQAAPKLEAPPMPVPVGPTPPVSLTFPVPMVLPPVPPPPQPLAVKPPAEPVMTDPSLSNPQVQEGVEIAKHLRSRGDTQGALEALRAADLRMPNQPIILQELALTYDAMLLPAKAEPYWKRLLKMGEQVAGDAYHKAKAKLEAPAAAPAMAEEALPLELGTCQVIKDPNVESGERVTVRLSILAKPGATINPAQMDLHVFLFEQINEGERIEQARAEAPEQKWVSAPVDWSQPDGEIIEITYNLPAPTEDEIRNIGNRSFHGYMVKLFYQNKLVGEQAEPVTLLEFSKQPSAPAPGVLDGTLFPKQ